MSFIEVLPPERTGPEFPEWFEARAKGITASEIAAVLGLSPYESPFSLYWRKRGVMPEQADTASMRWGRRLESYLADEFAERHPDYLVQPAGLYAHAERSWQLASPDRLIHYDIVNIVERDGVFHVEPEAVMEAKTAGSWDGWGDEGSEDIPTHYRAQVLWQMDTLSVPVAYLPVAVGRTYREYVVEYHPDDAQVMRAYAENFLDRVRIGHAPDVDGTPATIATLRALHPDPDDTEAQVPKTVAEGYRRAHRNKRKADAHYRRWEANLRQRMGSARKAVDPYGDPLATRQVYDVAEATAPRAAFKVDKLVPAKEKT